MNCKENETLIFPVSWSALHSWHPADKLILMALGYKAILTVSAGCLSQRESSACPKFYDLKLSGTEGEEGGSCDGFFLLPYPAATLHLLQISAS